MTGMRWMGGFLAVLGLAGACHDGVSEIRLTGEAISAPDSGWTASCELDLLFNPDEYESRRSGTVHRGKFGGGIQRAILDETGAGEAFLMDVYGDMVVERTPPDRVVVLLPESEGTESRFWQAIARLEGVDHDGSARGTWTCPPLDVDRGTFVDDTVSAEGEWTMTTRF